MRWYLRRYGNEEVQDVLDHTMWLELAFVYRDFTKSHFGKAHYVYQLIIVLISILFCFFIVGIFNHMKTVEYPLNIGIFASAAFAVVLMLGLIYKTSKKKYYMHK